MKKLSTPRISVIIPTYNEEKNIKKCLDSIFSQKYPRKLLEIIVVDDNSTDKTVEIARSYGAHILYSGKRHGEISKMLGFKKATGEYAIYFDADIALRGNDWFKEMLKPLTEDEGIIGAFTCYYAQSDDSPIERYLNMDPLQRDGIYRFFSPSIEEVITQVKEGYFVCEYMAGRIPPAGLCLYRREKLMSIVGTYEMFLELDFLALLVSKGFRKFSYVPKAGLYHRHVSSFKQLIKKRLYNLNRVYLNRETRLYKWFDIKSPIGLSKIIFWIIYANFFLPSLIKGIILSLKHKDWVGMYEPFVNIIVTDILLVGFLLNKSGRKLLKTAMLE